MFLSGDIWKIKLYPVRGSEQDGVRPCIIVSPNTMNDALSTIIVIPMTTQLKNWPTRIEVLFDNKNYPYMFSLPINVFLELQLEIIFSQTL